MKNIIFDNYDNMIGFSKDSLEMKNAKMVLKEIKKYYNINFNESEML